ncbi:leucine-rich repeat domain-containing protein [Hamadaea tsunoensis]|uniref:leucine-rich repeat domain-containing protein n=1 Tax=Hamadaea tsunoensis TaxID=53368 RepID=UPI00040C0C0D|nr:leucine-rich repeat domain-containing protein [Hamadaea tsunoensis]
MSIDKARKRIRRAAEVQDSTLDLSNLSLEFVPPEIADLTQLTYLDLGANQLTTLPAEIGNLTKLTHLNLRVNKLTVLPQEIGYLTRITNLNLGANRLTTLPAEIGNLTRLTYLTLGVNQLTELPPDIATLAQLIALGLHGNQLSELPSEIGILTQLTNLGLNGNQLIQLRSEIGNLTQLTYLNLGENQLTRLPPEIGNLTQLTYLNLGGNQLTGLPPEIGELSRLATLDLNGNQLTKLPPEIGELSRLATLHLNGNQLTGLPPECGDLTRLTELSLGDNPLVTPPPAVTAQGTQAVIEFMRGLLTRSQLQWRSKLLLVGQGGGGKTSLVKALLGLPYDAGEVTTHGLQITELSVPHTDHSQELGRGIDELHPDRTNVMMQLAVWDFGGQEIYHATHQFFLTDQSLFVLVWNARAGYEYGRLRYWLDLITARAPKAPILVVATHAAERGPDLPRPQLRAAYPKICDFIEVDNATRDGIDELRTLIARHAAALPLMGRPWPATWKAAQDAIRADSHTHMPQAQVRDLLADHGNPEPETQNALLGALHDLGEILHWSDDPELVRQPKIVFCSPGRWSRVGKVGVWQGK